MQYFKNYALNFILKIYLAIFLCLPGHTEKYPATKQFTETPKVCNFT